MMRHRIIFSTLTLFLFLVSVLGKPVTLTEVQDVVYTLLNSWDKDLDIEGIEARYLPGGELGYYMVDLGQDGWVMVSADDVIRPILAFSFENSPTPEESWNDAARYLLNQYQKEISGALKDRSLMRDESWDRDMLSDGKKSAAAERIEPIIDVEWDQGGGWNMFCPVDEAGPSDRVYVGCVAVAMAQAMSVHEYPEKPSGVKSYVHPDYGPIAVNYDMADPYEWSQMHAASADSLNAILLYHCAVSVEMDFGPHGSGAYVREAASAMIKYFNYSRNLSFKTRYDDTEEWELALYDELAAGRPLVYRGNPEDGSAGHAWNVDGYGDGYFHMNFGWSGSQNGYYTLDNINPGSYEFNSGQGAIIGIAPPISAPYDLSLSEMSVPEELPDSSYVADVIVDDEDSGNVYSFTCQGAYSVVFDDYGPASFYIEDGKLYTDKVFEYDESDPESNSEFLRITVKDQYGTEYTEDFEIDIEKVYFGPSGIVLSDTSVMENQPVGTAVAKLLVEDEDETNAYTFSLYGAYMAGTIDYDTASFYLESDSLRTSVVFDREVADTCFLLVELVDSYENMLSRAFTITIEPDNSGSTGIRSIAVESDLLYPNPADHRVHLRNTDRVNSLEIYESGTGRLVKIVNRVNESMDVSGIAGGLYLVVIRTEDEVAVQKLLIRH